MPRPPRIEIPGGIYHLYATSVTSRALFYDNRARSAFLSFVNAMTMRYSLQVFGYCLMSTHYHLLVRIEERDLSRGMQWLNSRFASAINDEEGERGHLFGARFGSKLVTDDEQLLATVRYIARNPVRAGICKRADDWPWSSYTVLVRGWRRPRFLRASFVLRVLDPNERIALRKLEALVEDSLFEPARGLNGHGQGLTLDRSHRDVANRRR